MAKERIEVFEERGIRYLQFGPDCIQSAMRISRPYSLVLDYTRAMMMALLLQPAPRHALIIGLGAGSVAKFLYHHYPSTRITVVEINPKVVTVARTYFCVPEESAHFSIQVGDGFTYVQESKRHFDIILVDGFDHNSRAGPLESISFYTACCARLSEHGVMAANLLGEERGFKATTERIALAFSGRAFQLRPSKAGNVVMLGLGAATDSLDEETLRERAGVLKEKTSLNVAFALPKQWEALNIG
ncbi:MAG: fused MFS/spermidine synthase [Pseudomonadota bacterium]